MRQLSKSNIVQPSVYWLRVVALFLASTSISMSSLSGQEAGSVRPTVGLRENPTSQTLLRGANVIRRASDLASPPVLDVLLNGSAIIALGEDLVPPPGCRLVDCQGWSIYPGLINACHEMKVPSFRSDYWNSNVVPDRSADFIESIADAEALREQGFTTVSIVPEGRIVRGASSVWLLSENAGLKSDPGALIPISGNDLRAIGSATDAAAWQHIAMTVSRSDDGGESYPRSPMGAMALLRQSFYDARWYRDASGVHEANSRLPRPDTSVALQTLATAMDRATFVIDCPNERMALRAGKIAQEFGLKAILRGSGREYRELEAIKQLGKPMLIGVDFPESPSVTSAVDAREVSLRELLHWHFAPHNPAMLEQAGIEFCLTTDGLDDVDKFLKQVRIAVKKGLSPETALAAMTSTPARLLGLEGTLGEIAPGMLANLVITNGDLFAKDTKVLQTWVAGREFQIDKKAESERTPSPMVGDWTITSTDDSSPIKLTVSTDGETFKGAIQFAIEVAVTEAKVDDVSEDTESKDTEVKPVSIKLQDVIARQETIDAVFIIQADTLREASSGVTKSWPAGAYRLSIAAANEITADEDVRSLRIEMIDPKSELTVLTAKPLAMKEPAEEEISESDKEKGAPDNSDQVAETIPLLHPLGAYGRTKAVESSGLVLFHRALVWTCTDQTDLSPPIEPSDVLVRDGVIEAIAKMIAPPLGATIVECQGQHLTPGIIDCHSHIATDGGINESGQSVTSEVRIGDFIDHSDINLYRQLAGGVTTASILHGSANPIGGQNQVIKFRWGDSMDAHKFVGAPAGIKFALGENVKRSRSRYPNTRMGVEQLIRDQFLAAREYAAGHQRWADGKRDSLPPRVDLQLEAMAEVQSGKRWVHCHSYRQDEIVATLDVLEEFGVQIGTLQHILEGYKVADRIKSHGAMASSFADWWAYKFEVYDAIPYNGVLMHDQGVVVSYNSDDAELGRHLNAEAAKAIKYGGVRPTEALKFITLNPAKQLRIDDRIGSIEVGKDADLVLWNGPPLSTTSRCLQTWIDGRKMFDAESDLLMRERDKNLREQLIQLVLAGEQDSGDEINGDEAAEENNEIEESNISEEDRWLRYDEYCNARGNGVNSRGNNQ